MRYPSPFPVPEGGAAVFADAHLGQAQGDGADFLTAIEEVAGRGFRTVVLLGDIFHYFIGDARFETPLRRHVLEGFARLAAAGIALRYVEGNRDFFVGGGPFATSFSRYGLTDGLEVGGRKWAFVHGDRVNTADLPYRFWRVASKNPVSRFALRAIPGAVARSIVTKTEARLYRSNFKHKRRLPEEALRGEARRARVAGYDEVLVGHFHVEKRLEAADGVVHVLPAWLEERKHAEISATGVLAVVEEESAARAVRREAVPG